MKILVIGGTGRTGQALAALALAKGHQVTIFGRRQPLNLAAESSFMTGDPQQESDLQIAIPGHNAVVSSLGQRSARDAGVLGRSAMATVAVMKNLNVRRYIVVSQGLLFPSSNPLIWLLRLILGRHVADSRAMENVVAGSDLDWTIVRPSRLTMGKNSRGYKIMAGGKPNGSISMDYMDLAACLLDIAEKRSHISEIVGVTSA